MRAGHGGDGFSQIKLDHAQAYRQLRASNDIIDRIVVVLDADGYPHYFRALKLLFGESASVLWYCAYAAVLSSLVRRLLRCGAVNYVDDFICAVLRGD